MARRNYKKAFPGGPGKTRFVYEVLMVTGTIIQNEKYLDQYSQNNAAAILYSRFFRGQ